VTQYLDYKSWETLNSAASSLGMPVRWACAVVDWASFAREWRASYYQFILAQADHKGDNSLKFKTVDDHHFDSLRALITQHDIEHLWREEEVLEISRVWHSLYGWPDSTSGLQALRDRGFMVCTLSNGNSR
jgi:2-haloacid dehalogenase